MLINLVNTTIPFEEYQLTQDRIDALKFRLLESESYLGACDLMEYSDSFECYRVYFLPYDKRLLFLMVGNSLARSNGYPMLTMVDVSDGTVHTIKDEELINEVHEKINMLNNP